MDDISILIIDPDPQQSRYLETILTGTDNRHRIIAVETGSRAQAILEHLDIQIILVDYFLPDMSGLEFVRILATKFRTLPCAIIMMTNEGHADIAVESLKIGISDYLVKEMLTRDNIAGIIDTAISNFVPNRSIRTITNILYLSNSPENSDLIRKLLLPVSSFQVYIVNNLKDFNKTIETHPVQLVLMPLKLADGKETLPYFHKQHPEIPVIIIDEADETKAVQAIKQGANDFLANDGQRMNNLPEIITATLAEHEVSRIEFHSSKELSYQRNLMEIFVKHSPAAIAMFDTEMHYVLASKRWYSDYNIALDNIIGMSHYEVFPEISDEWKALHQRSLKGETLQHDADPFPRLDGSIDYVTWELRPWYQSDQSIGGIIMMTQVVTDKIENQEALRHSEQRFRAIFNQTFQFVGLMSPDGTLLEANNTALEFAGLTRGDITNKPKFWDLNVWAYSEESIEQVKTYVARAAEGEFVRDEVLVQSSDGSFVTIDFSIKPMLDDDGNVIMLIPEGRDISDRIQAENERKAVLEDLKQANEEIQEFAYIVSHDLRTPLVNLKGFTSILKKNVEDIIKMEEKFESVLNEVELRQWQESTREDIPVSFNFIDMAIKRLDKFTAALLTLSRIGSRDLTITTVDTQKVVHDVLASLQVSIDEKKVQIYVDHLPAIEADALAIDQIFSNIIINAIKYLSPDRQGEIHIYTEENADTVTFHIADNGRGIAPHDFPKIFQPFRRAGLQDVEGLGMGLPYVQTIIRRLNGDIWFESDLDSGTTFSFTLPRKNRV